MSAICDVDLATFCGRIGNVYMQHRMCPPFALRDAVQGWIARDIPLWYCVDVIERFLSRHAGNCHSGSGDWHFSWLNSLIQTNWSERQVTRPKAQSSRPTMQQIAAREWDDRQQSADHELDARRDPPNREAPAGNGSDAPGYSRADHAAEPIGPKAKQPQQIDRAITFLRRELANGEVAVTRLEEKAKTSGISLRTLDRARARLNVISRRTGFAKEGKCWCSLPRVP